MKTHYLTPKWKVLIHCFSALLCLTLTYSTATAQSTFKVKIDSHVIHSTPNLDSILLAQESTMSRGSASSASLSESEMYYSDITMYEFTPEAAPEALFPTLVLLSGGGFFELHNPNDLNPASELHENLSLAKKIASQGFKVFWIEYEVATDINATDALWIAKLLIDTTIASQCSFLANERSKAKIEQYSLLSFRDFRVQFKGLIDNYTANQIDPANVFVAGISAGGVLSFYSVFLDQAEIPSSITYATCNDTNVISIPSNVRTQGYPIPAIKGIIPMVSGSFYNNIFSNNTAYTSTVAMNIMHGTCDELINQNQGRVSYKFIQGGWHYNTYPANRYPNIYGSQNIYNLIQASHPKASYCQVIRGGHSPISPVKNLNYAAGGWDIYTAKSTISDPPDMNIVYNPTNPLYDNILSFMNRVRGVSSPAWGNTTYSMLPELPTTGCLSDNVNPITPPFSITAPNYICATGVTATLNPAIPLGATVVWTATANVSLSSPTSSSVTATRVTNAAGTATITATITYNGNVVAITKNIPIYPTLVGTMYNTVPFAINGVNQSISTQVVMPIGVPVNLSFTLPNATAMGVTDLQWLSKCGTVFTTPTLTWIGTSLKSEITVQYDTDSACQNLNVRPINGCGIGAWRIQQAAIQSLTILLSPNPANASVSIQLSSNYAIPYPLSYTITQVTTGTVVRSGTITTSSTSVNTAALANGNYVVNVYNANISATANLVVQH